MKLNKKRILLSAAAFISFLALIATTIILSTNPQLATKASATLETEPQLPPPTIKYGFVLDSFKVTEAEIGKNEFLSEILTEHGVDYVDIDVLAKKSKDIFDVRKLRSEKQYTILSNQQTGEVEYFIYEPSAYNYVVYNLTDTISVQKVERTVTTKMKTASGIIESSLWNALVDNDMPWDLAIKMEDALAWSVDFHHLHTGDKFKLLYEEKYIDGDLVGVGGLDAAFFHHGSDDMYAFLFKDKDGEEVGYYDEQARPMKKAFLKAPVKYTRISSRYNLRRFHPIKRRVVPHLGTDYAAPRGTPIYAVASGVITKASRTRGNGIYVKIKHDDVYSSQYLHMNRRAAGITKGTHVKQGRVIGYVGSTGLATGPHVCFRFWKRGKQVDFLREKLPPPKPMEGDSVDKFYALRDSLKVIIDDIPFAERKEIIVQQVDENTESDSLSGEFIP